MIYTVTLNTAIDRTIEVPDFRIGGVCSGRTVCEQPAGKGVNVSRCLVTLRAESVVGGFVGTEEATYFASSFSGTIARSRLIAVPGHTRRDTTLIDPVAHTDTHIRESGYIVAPEHLERLRAELKSNLRPDDIVVFCGSPPPGISPGAFGDLLTYAHALGCKIAVDTSGEALLKSLAAHPFLMKPNRVELETLTTSSRHALDSVPAVVAAGRSLLNAVQMLVVSLGKDGAVLIARAGVWYVTCELAASEVQSTVGCGDALLAGFLAAIQQHRSPAESLRLAVVCGSACALTPTAGLIHPADVERLLRKTQLTELG